MDVVKEIDRLTNHLEFLKTKKTQIEQSEGIGVKRAEEILLTCELIADRMRYYLLRRAR